MVRYQFIVREKNKIVFKSKPVEMAGIHSVWNRIAELAREYGDPGTRIAVNDQNGNVIISIGVLAAQKLSEMEPSRQSDVINSLDG
jgi:hypothetical protein